MNQNLLFVYGTLQKACNHQMHNLLEKYAEFVAKGRCQGQLFKIDYYPGLVPSQVKSDQVLGEVYRVHTPEILFPALDRYEGCGQGFQEPTEYIRELQKITFDDSTTSLAWVYLYNWPTKADTRIISGDFLDSITGDK